MDTRASEEGRLTADRFFALVEEGLFAPDERAELLDGIIVAMPPQDPPHASGVRRVERALRLALGPDAVLSCQLPLIADTTSVAEPDLAVLPGRLEDYDTRHPTTALLVVEVADSSLAQDRLTKTRLYARAKVPNYWIVNLRSRVVEWFADPDPELRVYRSRGIAAGEDRLPLRAFAGIDLCVDDLLPPLPV